MNMYLHKNQLHVKKKIHIERPEFNVAEEALFKKLH